MKWEALAVGGIIVLAGLGIAKKVGPLPQGQLPANKTPIPATVMFQALATEWSALWNETPSRAQLLTLLSQWDFETGGGDSMIDYNVGNFKSVEGDGYKFSIFKTREVNAQGQEYFIMGRFRAYSSLQEGIKDYLLTMKKRFGSAWKGVLDANPAEFAHLLKLAYYYTGSEAEYTAGLLARYKMLDQKIPQGVV